MMANLRPVSTIVVVLCALALVSGQMSRRKGGSGGGRQQQQAAAVQKSARNGAIDKSCSPFMFGKPCCNLPTLVPKESFSECMPKTQQVGARKGAVGAKAGAGKAAQAGGKAAQSGAKSAGSKRVARSPDGAAAPKAAAQQTSATASSGGPACVMECVMTKNKLLNSDNKLDEDAISELFQANSNELWKAKVAEVTKTCLEKVKNLNLSPSNNQAPWGSGGKTCSYESALFMTCMRRDLILGCPDEANNNVEKKDAVCNRNIDGLNACNALEIPKPTNYLEKLAQRAKQMQAQAAAAKQKAARSGASAKAATKKN